MMPRVLFLQSVPFYYTVLSTEGAIIPFDLHFVVMVKILISCLCSPVIVQSAMRQDMSHCNLLL
jgi:hypothetical protein